MIFVTVGTHYQGFDRLIKKMDEIARKINDEVIMQIGYSRYEPRNAKWFRFLEENDILELYKKADIIVAHAGAGTLLTVLSFGKPLVIVPRLKEFKEHVDNQQLELAEALEAMGKAIAVYDVDELEDAIEKAKLLRYKPINRNKRLINFLREYLRGIEK